MVDSSFKEQLFTFEYISEPVFVYLYLRKEAESVLQLLVIFNTSICTSA